jgi:TonB family protein
MKTIAALSIALLLMAAALLAQDQNSPEQVYRVGGTGGATAPKCSPVMPNYTDDARQAHIQGEVGMDIIVHADGSVTVSKVTQPLGYGLDEEAEKAMTKTKCTPGQVDGRAVSVFAQVKISFRLLV